MVGVGRLECANTVPNEVPEDTCQQSPSTGKTARLQNRTQGTGFHRMGNVFSPIGTQLCLILRPMPHAASPTSECPRPPTLRLHAQHRPPSLRDTAGSCRACICICLSMCVSERYFIFQVLWLISVTKISFMTIPIC